MESTFVTEIKNEISDMKRIRAEESLKKATTLSLKTHTVILTVGPTGAGKTYFCKNYLIPELKRQFVLPENTKSLNVQYIGSDDIRRDLGGICEETDYPYYMQNVSAQAFDYLYKRLELVLSWPIKAEFVIVDTTGLTQQFRETIVTLARDYHYNICCLVFDYKNRDDYFKYLEGKGYDGSLISDHIARLRRKALQNITKKDFDPLFYFREKSFDFFRLELVDAELYTSCFLPWKKAGIGRIDYPIIGDVHGDLDALKTLLTSEFKGVLTENRIEFPPYRKPILLGDFIDKGNKIAETIEFLYENRDVFLFILGNHESFVYRIMKGTLKEDAAPQEIMEDFFSTLDLLRKDNVLTEKFYTLCEMAKPFYIGENFIATHSPCVDNALGKIDLRSQRLQRNYRLNRISGEKSEDMEARVEKELGDLVKPNAAHNKPFHVWGHIALKKIAKYQNKVGIDTAASHGNILTAATVGKDRIYFSSVPATNPIREQYLPTIFQKQNAAVVALPDVNMDDLNEEDFHRISRAAKDKINFISGTMSPSNKDIVRGTLESIRTCFEYYRSKEVTVVCLQPKYMGSRANVYLCRDVVKSYSVTRKGYSCIRDGNREKLQAEYGRLYKKQKVFMDEYDFEWLILDSELMPWYALGRGLIESQYAPVSHGLERDLSVLEATGFEAKLQALFEEKETSGFNSLKGHATKAELMEKFKIKQGTYRATENFNFIPISKQREYLEIYKEQLRLFASPNETLEFKPFSILKGIHSNEEEMLFFDWENSALWNQVSDDECIVIDLTDFESAVAEGEKFFQKIMDAKLEGVVVKPETVHIPGVAPYMKVRNPFYLYIIYGLDWQEPRKLERLIKQKGIGRKLQASVDEWEYGKRMLEIPRKEISMENKEYLALFAKMIFEERKEEKFDPRL